MTLKKYGRKEFFSQPPVSKAAMAILQHKSLEGDPESRIYFRKYIIALGAHIAHEEAIKNELDEDYLLRHINIGKLEKTCYQTDFNVFGQETIHIDTVRKYIQKVILKIYTTTTDGQYIKTVLYIRARKALNQNPCLNSLSHPRVDGVPTGIVLAVRDNEAQIRKEKALEKAQFRCLKIIIRDSNLPYEKKKNLLINLTNTGEYTRRVFYYHFGVHDGIMKSAKETADFFNKEPDAIKHILSLKARSHDSCINHDALLYNSVTHFLCRNRKNRKEYRKGIKEIRKIRNEILELIEKLKMTDYLKPYHETSEQAHT